MPVSDYLDQVMANDSPDSEYPADKLESSLDIAAQRNPDKHAESLSLSIQHDLPVDTVDRQIDEVKKRNLLQSIDIDKLRSSHPKTSKWLSNTDNASVSIDDMDILKGMEDTLKEPERGFWNNVARGGLNTVNKLTGDLIEFAGNTTDDFDDFIVRTTGLPNPGIVFGEDGVSMSWDVPPEKTGIEEFGKAISKADVYDYKPDFTWEKLKGDVTPTNLAGYILEQGVQSLPHMAAVMYTLPAYIASRTEGIAEERVANDEREDVTGADLATSVVPATIVALMEKLGAKATFGLGKTVGAKGVGKAIGAAATTEGLTEFAQEGIEYTGETLGTKKDFSFAEMVDRQFAGLVAGAGMGGGIRGVSATVEAIGNRTQAKIIETGRSNSEQQTIDQIVSYAQTSTTNNRATAQFQDFINSLGEDRDVLVPNDIASELIDAPDYITEQLNDLGTSVSIPMDKFAGEIAKNQEWMAILRPHIKLSEGSLSQAETETDDQTEIQSLLKKAMDEKETMTEADRIFKDVKDQLKATGMQGESTARQSAQLYPAAAAAMVEKAKKAGHDMSLEDAYEMMGFSVERGDVDAVIAEGQILDQPAEPVIPDDLEIEMESEIIETGETVTETFNAKELSTEINDKLESYQRLRDCLA